MAPLRVPVGSFAPAPCRVSMTRGCVATRGDATTGFLSVGRRCLPSDMAERMGCCADLAVAEGLNFGPATERLPTAGFSLSRQIKVLERGSRTVQAVRTVPFRWCAVDDRPRPHEDCRPPPRRSRRGGPAAPGSGRSRRQRRSLGGERAIPRPALASRQATTAPSAPATRRSTAHRAGDPVIGKHRPSGCLIAADWVGSPELPHYEGRSICALSPSHLDMIDNAGSTRP